MRLIAALFLTAAPALLVAAKTDLSPAEVDEIIRKFAEKETEFARARENYTYRQTARIFEYDQAGNPGGKFEVVSDIIFNADGKRTERIVRAPVPTLRLIGLTPEDEQDLRAVQPFVLTTKDIDRYHVRYLGHEQIDEIPCYVFAVKPKKMEPGLRYFSGIVWVDDRDLQIVKSYGRGTGLAKKNFDNKFPKFETFREQIDGRFWFPTYTVANDTLFFDDGQVVKIRMTVRYEDYKQFKSDVKITFGEPVSGESKPTPEAPKP
jgi:hypothetical protein